MIVLAVVAMAVSVGYYSDIAQFQALPALHYPHHVQGGKSTARTVPWQPYESAPRENYFLGFMPVKFYELRWAFMRYNPLTWTVGQKSYTYGEAITFLLILAQMLWVSFMWAFHPEFRVDVLLTGVLQLHPPHLSSYHHECNAVERHVGHGSC